MKLPYVKGSFVLFECKNAQNRLMVYAVPDSITPKDAHEWVSKNEYGENSKRRVAGWKLASKATLSTINPSLVRALFPAIAVRFLTAAEAKDCLKTTLTLAKALAK